MTALCSIDWAEVAKVFSALMTPVIAVIASLIAYQQYVINRRQHRLALLERRMIIFDSLMDLIAHVIQTPREVSLDAVFGLLRNTREHDFLFGAEIGEYIDEVYKKALLLEAGNFAGQLNQEALNWFQGQSAIATQKFMKYIDFRKP